jgi:hypothetical protein
MSIGLYAGYNSQFRIGSWHREAGNTEAGWTESLGDGRCELRAFAVDVGMPRDTLRALVVSNPMLTDIVWHTLPEGMRWVGRYAVARNSPNGVISAALGDDGQPISFACPHCAAIASLAQDFAALGGHPQILGYNPEDGINDCFLPPTGELFGSPAPANTSTVKSAATDAIGRACGQCGLLGHNSRTCTRAPQAINKIGIEIEGRYHNLRDVRSRAASDGLGGDSDGSLRGSPDSDAQPWEFKTVPGSLRDALTQLVNFYPDETDGHCGMHVHLSFHARTAVTLLATPQFYEYFRASWAAWGRANNLNPRGQFFKRLDGHNDYCAPNRDIMREDGDDNMRCVDRYTQMNWSSWDRHGTVECRLLPMFIDSKLGVSAVTHLVTMIEDWLATGANVLTMPEVDLTANDCSAPDLTYAAAYEIETPDPVVEGAAYTLELEELPPVSPGYLRVAVPEGPVRDFLANLSSQRAA